MINNIFIFLLIVFLLVGCATSSKDFEPGSIDRNRDGVIIGNFQFKLNGVLQSENCRVIFNDDDRTFVKLDETGNVFARATKGKVFLKRILCQDGGFGGDLVSYDFQEGELSFENKGDGVKTYFGHVKVYWSSEDRSIWWFFLSPGAAAAMGDHTKKLMLTNKDELNKILKEYNETVKEQKKLKVRKSIIRINYKYRVPEQVKKL